MLDLTNATEQTFEVLPAGMYLVRCTVAKIKPTKSGDGEYIEVELTVSEGEAEGRKLFHRFNINNPNAKAQEIGLGQLKSYLTKSGHADPNKLETVGQLEGLQCVAQVVIRNDPGYGPQNDIKYFKSVEESEKQAGTTGFAPTQGGFT